MIADVQGISADFLETRNQAKVAQTYVNSTQRYQETHEDVNSTESTTGLYTPNTEAIHDVLQLEHIETYLQYASGNLLERLPQRIDWGSIIADNNAQQSPIEASQLLHRVTAVNTYSKNK